jgi:hypothetical protein
MMSSRAMGISGPERWIGNLLLLSLLTIGCFRSERKPTDAKPVIPVGGVVLVNGKPVAGIQIKFHAVSQDPQNATLSMAKTDDDGAFHAWTYRADDGVPPGEYTLTFDDQSQAKPHLRSNQDLFKGKYSNPKTSKFKLTVPEDGEPVDMGEIELTR